MKLRNKISHFFFFAFLCLCGSCLLPDAAVSANDSPQYEGEGMIGAPSEDTGESGSVFVKGAEEILEWDPGWEYASFSRIHTGTALLCRSETPNGYTVCVNAGHGTAGGSGVQTPCHPDGSPKVTGGSTAEGAVYAAAVSDGAEMLDGTTEASVNLKLALLVKERLLSAGYHVLMIRESDDVQLDNIARTVLANQYADCHLALHYDSTESDKGFFYIGVPEDASYRAMEPVASHWQEHEALGKCILSGMQDSGVKIFDSGRMPIDLMQTSYSTIPSIDVECGDRASDYTEAAQGRLADGIVKGVELYFFPEGK